MHSGQREHLGKRIKNGNIREICSNRGRPHWLKDKAVRGCSADETAKTGKCEVTETQLKAKQNLSFILSTYVAIVTSYNKLSGRKPHQFYYSSKARSLKSKYQFCCFPSGVYRWESMSLTSQACRDTYNLCVVAPSSIYKARIVASSTVKSFSDSLF